MAQLATMAIPENFEQLAPDASQRAKARRELRLIAHGTQPSGETVQVLVHNISETGLLVESENTLAEDDRIEIDLPHCGPTTARIVWASGRLFGCRFDKPITPAALSAAQLKSGVRGDLHLPEDEPASPVTERFGARLQRLRIAKGYSQTEVAAHMGVSVPSISGWEKGRARPKHGRVAALAAFLDVPVAELLGEASSQNLHELIDQSREHIAQVIGTTTDKIRIVIEL